MLGCELLDGGLCLLLENQSGFTFTGILHHLHLHLFSPGESKFHISVTDHVESEKAHRIPPTLHFPSRLPKLKRLQTHLEINTIIG